MPRTTALWWWIDRWRDSKAFRSLNIEQQGLHRELISQSVLRGGWLPKKPSVLRRVTGATQEEWTRCWRKVRRFWKVEGDRLLPGDEVRLYVSRFRRLPPLVVRGGRRHIPMRIQRAVFARDGGRCVECGSDHRLELDHVHRHRDGGPDTFENLRLLCRPCNRRRS